MPEVIGSEGQPGYGPPDPGCLECERIPAGGPDDPSEPDREPLYAIVRRGRPDREAGLTNPEIGVQEAVAHPGALHGLHPPVLDPVAERRRVDVEPALESRPVFAEHRPSDDQRRPPDLGAGEEFEIPVDDEEGTGDGPSQLERAAEDGDTSFHPGAGRDPPPFEPERVIGIEQLVGGFRHRLGQGAWDGLSGRRRGGAEERERQGNEGEGGNAHAGLRGCVREGFQPR